MAVTHTRPFGPINKQSISMMLHALRCSLRPTKHVLTSARAMSSSAGLKETPLHGAHVEVGAKMVPFCGWDMPVQYKGGVLKEHMNTRENASLFDVSHMGQLRITGKDRVKFMEKLVVGDIAELPQGHSKLSLITNKEGGILDDTVITQDEDFLYVVINAGCFDSDMEHIRQQLGEFNGDVNVDVIDDHALIALQGPKAAQVLSSFTNIDLVKMDFMTSVRTTFSSGIPVRVTRCGYTGEDGFEISLPASNASSVFHQMVERDEVMPAGLGARDSLRLEAGLCLYGNDLDETIRPVQASLNWTIGKRRREEGGFNGAEAVLRDLKEGVDKKRVGLVWSEGPPSRGQSDIVDANGELLGKVTSGCPSPSLGKKIAMGYVKFGQHKIGTEVNVVVRNKTIPAVITKMPFVPAGYYRAPK